ncbi:MAG: TSUP family transporter [Candidatus Methylophosphatis roskildensis]
MELPLLLAGAFIAGLIDAVVGGGGLIQIPLLFSAFPQTAAATIFGTNKLAAVFGTASAALRYVRRVRIPWRAALPAAGAAFFFAFLGATTVTVLPQAILKPLVSVLLVVVAAYTWTRKDFGQTDLELQFGRRHTIGALVLGGGIGFYDGFFGPGTGSFLIFLFVRFFGFDFLRASATAKVVNVMTNFAALLHFGSGGAIMWQLGFGMAVLNMAGALIGSELALRHGSWLVRCLFLVVVSLLIVRFAWELLEQ